MSITPFKTFAPAEILTASDLNSSFSKITDNGEDLAWPATKAKDLDGQSLILDLDGDTSITADTDDRIDFACAGFDVVRMNTVASAVNGIDATGSATGNAVVLAAYGSDTDIGVTLTPKGVGDVVLGGHKAKGLTSAVNFIELASSATGNAVQVEAAGSDTDIDIVLAPKGAGVVTGIPFSKSFTSSEQTITHAGALTPLAHSLGAMPSLIQLRLICKTAEFGYSIDDEVMISMGASTGTAAGDAAGVSIVPDSTNINVRFNGSGTRTFNVVDKSDGDHEAITDASWKLIVKAWA